MKADLAAAKKPSGYEAVASALGWPWRDPRSWRSTEPPLDPLVKKILMLAVISRPVWRIPVLWPFALLMWVAWLAWESRPMRVRRRYWRAWLLGYEPRPGATARRR